MSGRARGRLQKPTPFPLRGAMLVEINPADHGAVDDDDVVVRTVRDRPLLLQSGLLLLGAEDK